MTWQNVYQIENVLGHQHFAIISAWKTDATVSVNLAAGLRLREELTSMARNGIHFTKCKGKYGGSVEPSYLITGDFDDKRVVGMGARYRQESVMIGDNGHIFLRFMDERPDAVAKGWELVSPEATDDFTEVTLANGKQVRFTVVF